MLFRSPHGSTLVHMKLTRAIEHLDTLEGLRTHRSWWIARHAVMHVEGTPRSMRLCLRNGLSAPVARSAVTVLRQAGWLKDPSVTEDQPSIDHTASKRPPVDRPAGEGIRSGTRAAGH